MGFGNNCCVGGLYDEIDYYNGTALTSHSAFSSLVFAGTSLLSNRRKSFVRNDLNLPMYMYDMDFVTQSEGEGLGGDVSNFILIAAGGDGLLKYRLSQDGATLESLEKTYLENNLGERYGYDEFKGCYGVKVIGGRYAYVACGRNGAKVIDLKTHKVKQIIDLESNIFNTRTEDVVLSGSSGEGAIHTIVNQVALAGKYVCFGTTGYDRPVTEIYDYSFQFFYQPEFDYTDPDKAFTDFIEFYGGTPLEPKGIFLVEGDEPVPVKTIDNSLVSSVVGYFELDVYINKILFVIQQENENDVINIAHGKREEKLDGYYPELDKNQDMNGGVIEIKLKENEETQVLTLTQGRTYGSKPCMDLFLHEEKVYALFYNELYRDRTSIFDFDENRNYRICPDPDTSNCIAYDKELNLQSVPSGSGVIIDSRINPTRNIISSVFCELADAPYGPSQNMGIFGTGLTVTENAYIISLFNGGYIIYNRKSRKVSTDYKSLFKIEECEKFVNPDKDPTTFDLNPDITLATGRQKIFKNHLFIIDSMQYVANGSGPGVYNPIETSLDVERFVGLIKGFNQFSGILTLFKKNNN